MISKFMRFLGVGAISIALCFPGFAQTAGIPAHAKLVPLFNGRNLKGFDIILKNIGMNKDPNKVFQVEDGGVLHVSGNGFGGIITKKTYGDYYLRAEFKWGDKTYLDRVGKARDCGILYNISGPLLTPTLDMWPRSFEFQIVEGGTGDIWLIKGSSLKVKGQTITSSDERGHQYVRSPRFGAGPWQNVTGFRDPVGEVENPHGEWNLLELVLDGNHVKYFVNGKLVNEGTDLNATSGKILFQTEGAETYYRNMQIAKLKK
ncbi:MAG: DUF1080 domain-containing protein [Edaphobacter sp.]